MSDTELLRSAILKSGLTTTRFAAEVMSRDQRTVRRWLAGQPIPRAAKEWLERYTQNKPGKSASVRVVIREPNQ